jgi:hypothetical protein
MEPLTLIPTLKTPEVNFNSQSGELKITGCLFPEDPNDFFQPVLAWLDDYSKSPAPNTTFLLNLKYFNSGAHKYLYKCFKRLEEMADEGDGAKIIWEYENEDEDIKEMGEDYRQLLKINFEMKVID